MKNLKLLSLLGIIFALSFSSCENQNLVENPEQSTIPANHMEMLMNMGFDLSMVKDNGDTYIIDGDILIEKSELPLYGQVPETRQAHYKYTVKSGKRSLIRVKVDSAVPESWAEATANAVAAWNGLGTEIEMSITTGSSYEIIVRKGSGFESSTIARAVYPSSSGNPGSYVEINDDYTNTYNVSQLTYVMVHEFGHNLGFTHSNWSTSGEGLNAHDLYEIQGTPSSMYNPDIESVMYSHSGGRKWDGCCFTDYDKIAARYVYNTVTPSIYSNHNYVNGLAFTYRPIDLSITYNRSTSYQTEWMIPSGAIRSGSSFTFTSPGKYDLKYRVGQGGCYGEWYTISIEVINSTPADQWNILDLKVENGKAIYRLVYNSVNTQISYPELWVQFLYNGTYDNSLYNGSWDWYKQGCCTYLIPPVQPQHGSSCLISNHVSIKKGDIYVKEITAANNHSIYSGYNTSNIEIANIFGGTNGSSDIRYLYSQLIWSYSFQ